MRCVFSAFILILAATVSTAQIMAVHFKDNKAAEKYRKYLIQVNGEYIVAGEPKPGGYPLIDPAKGAITTGKSNVFFLADPGAPEKVAYTLTGETRVEVKGASVVAIPQEDIARLSYLMRDQTLAGLAAEHALRIAGIEGQKAKRDVCDKTSREWAVWHGQVVAAYERLRDWMRGTLFGRAADKLEKTILTEAAAMKDDAVRTRAMKAQKSVKSVPTPEELVAASQSITAGKVKFKVQESQHIRVVYDLASVNDSGVSALLRLGETCIEGFRREFIDPYLDEDFEDLIPEDLFIEFWFGPAEIERYERFWKEYYGRSFDGENREVRLQMSGTRARATRGMNYVDYWKSTSASDLEGMVAHGLGHALSNIHFNLDGARMPQDWLSEGVAYYMSFEFLGRNSVTCKDFQNRTYAHDPGAEGLKTVALGQRAAFNELAMSKGAAIDALALKSLFQMDDADLAKSWSFFDFVARKEGLKGIIWLRSACQNARTAKGFIDRWRDESEAILECKGQDPFKLIDDRWKAFAKAGQKKDDAARKVK